MFCLCDDITEKQGWGLYKQFSFFLQLIGAVQGLRPPRGARGPSNSPLKELEIRAKHGLVFGDSERGVIQMATSDYKEEGWGVAERGQKTVT